MRDPDYITSKTCHRCKGDGYDPDQPDVSQYLHLDPSPIPCRECEGTGKEFDPVAYNQYMNEYMHRTYGL